MNRALPRTLLLLLAGLTAGAPLASRLRGDDAPAATAKPRFIYTLTITDKLHLTVFQEDDLSVPSTQVDASGNINLPLLGDFHVAGLTVDQAQQAVAKAYVDQKFLRHPQVTISIDDYAERDVTIQGQVRAPGRFILPPESGMSVVELVTKAGGFTDIAKGSDVVVTHYAADGSKTVTKVDVQSIIKGKASKSQKVQDNSLLLQPGDIVFVPESII